MERYTKNFTVAEFASRDGKDRDARMCPVFMDKLQVLRDAWDAPLIITSGMRSRDHNIAVGGSKNSQHLKRPGIACDIACIDWGAYHRHRFIKLAMQYGFKGIGISKNFIHLDMREHMSSLWIY